MRRHRPAPARQAVTRALVTVLLAVAATACGGDGLTLPDVESACTVPIREPVPSPLGHAGATAPQASPSVNSGGRRICIGVPPIRVPIDSQVEAPQPVPRGG